MTLSEFETTHTGVKTGNTPENTGQCVGLVSVWMDTLGIAHEWGDAKDLLLNADTSQFDVIQNTPDGVPQAGDILVWGTKIGPYGHTAIFLHGDQNSFTSFDQNWPVGSLPHEQQHDYTGLLGWLHPKVALGPTMTLDDATFKKLVHNSTCYDLTCEYVGVPHNSDFGEVQKILDNYKKTITDLESEGVKLNQQVADSAKQVAQLKEDDSNLGLRNLDLGHTVDDLTSQLKTLWNALGSSTTNDSLKQIDTLKSSHEDVVKNVVPIQDALAAAAIKQTKQTKKDSALRRLANKLLFWLR